LIEINVHAHLFGTLEYLPPGSIHNTIRHMYNARISNSLSFSVHCTLDRLVMLGLMEFIHVENMVVSLIFFIRGLK
jgi:hypothetical protein